MMTATASDTGRELSFVLHQTVCDGVYAALRYVEAGSVVDRRKEFCSGSAVPC